MTDQQPGSAPFDLDVDEVEVAKLYAASLWEVAVKQGKQKEIVDEFNEFVDEVLLVGGQELRTYFNIVAVDQQQRAAFIEKTFRGNASDLLCNFFLTLNKHSRLNLVLPSRKVLNDLWGASQNQVAVTARTATAIPADQMESLKKSIAEKFKIVPILLNEVDPAVLGGIWLRVGEKVYDRTLRSDLLRLKENILSRRPNEI